MVFRQRRELKRARIEIIPMIDTMFFLLVFFMLSSLALTRLDGLPVDLPEATTAPRVSASEVTITIDRQSRIYVNKQAVQLDGLVGTLRRLVSGRAKDTSVVLNADRTVPHGLVVSCIDRARAANLHRFAIATDPEGTTTGGTP